MTVIICQARNPISGEINVSSLRRSAGAIKCPTFLDQLTQLGPVSRSVHPRTWEPLPPGPTGTANRMSAQAPWQLDRYRAFLHLQVRQLQWAGRFHRRFDSSDLVQETLLKAHAELLAFRGTSERELLCWLQRILANVFADEVRRARAQKRDLALEQSLQAAAAESSARLEAFLGANQSSPSEQAERHELLLRIAAALNELPEDQRDVVTQRDLLGASVREIAVQLSRTEKSVAGLLLRGRRKLRELLGEYG